MTEGVEHGVPAAIRRGKCTRGDTITFERGPVFGCTERSGVRVAWRKSTGFVSF